MLFNSIQFLVFFPLVTLFYFLLPHRFRWVLLLAASCYFYMFFVPYYILILIFTIIIDYFAGILIEKQSYPKQKKIFLIVSIIANIGVLAIFKYYDFFIDNINSIFHLLNSPDHFEKLSIILPIGLSFHTFQAMSYTIEVYHGKIKAERHFGIYALYVMFYPQLVAGPIERPQNILPQLHRKNIFDAEKLISGLRLMLWGIFKKVVIADTMAQIVNPYYDDVNGSEGWQLLLASYCFAIQIYCDFSGYSDIALGAARTMGYSLMQNFKTPYFSKSISEFWSRWHISLSSWFRDYVYIPLGGNQTSKNKWLRNLIIVFLISGLWHGANWTYIVWGGLHAFFLIFSIMTLKARNKIRASIFRNHSVLNFWDILITFNLVTFAWIFFRANSVSEAFIIIEKISMSLVNIKYIFSNIFTILSFSQWLVFACLVFMFSFERKIDLVNAKFKGGVNNSFFICLLLLIILLGKSTQEQFIYFQF